MTLPFYLETPSAEWYDRVPWTCLDLETTNIEKGDPCVPDNRAILEARCSDTSRPVYVTDAPLLHWPTAAKQPRVVVAHNAKFELGWMLREGIDITNILPWDTMLAEYVIAGNRRVDLSLGGTAKRYGLPGKEPVVDRLIKAGVCPSEIPRHWLEARVRYDVETTMMIARMQHEILKREGLMNVFFTRCITTPVLAAIEREGMTLDPERVDEEYTRTVAEMTTVTEELDRMTGGINLRSGKQLGEYLYDTLKFQEPTDRKGNCIRTAKGARSTSKATLEGLVAKTPKQKRFRALQAKYAKLNARLTKSLEFFAGVCREHDGTFRGRFNQAVTQTHRLSSSGRRITFRDGKARGVQFQNLPREYKRLFVARMAGRSLVETDGCFTAGHLVRMADGSEKPVEQVAVGDILAGVDENITREPGAYRGRDRKMRRAVVEKTAVRRVPCFVVYLDDRAVTVSAEHPFLARDSHKRAWRWITAEEMYWNENDRQFEIRREHTERLVNDARLLGKLAAYIDGEGSWDWDKCTISQCPNTNPDVCEDIESTLRGLGVPYSVHAFANHVRGYTITGTGWLLAIQTQARPQKAMRDTSKVWEGKQCKTGYFRVMGVSPCGEKDVYSIQTSTRTYMAAGLINHNCQLEFRVAGQLGNDPRVLADVESGADIHRFTASILLGKPEAEVTDKERTAAKPDTFKPLYGGMSGTKAQVRYYEAFREKYKGVFDTQTKWTVDVLNTKKLRIASGLVFYWADTKIKDGGYITNTPSIFNYPVQSFATADIIPISLVYTYWGAKDLDAVLINTVHDSVVADVADEDIEAYKEVVRDAWLTRTYNYLEKVYGVKMTVPLAVGVKIARHWGDTKNELKFTKECK